MRATYRFIAPVDFKEEKRQMLLITCSRRKRRVSILSTTAYPTLSLSAVYQEARFGQQRELVTVVVAHSPCKCFFLSLSSSLSLSLSPGREREREEGRGERNLINPETDRNERIRGIGRSTLATTHICFLSLALCRRIMPGQYFLA